MAITKVMLECSATQWTWSLLDGARVIDSQTMQLHQGGARGTTKGCLQDRIEEPELRDAFDFHDPHDICKALAEIQGITLPPFPSRKVRVPPAKRK